MLQEGDPVIFRAMSKRSWSLGSCSVRPAKRPSQRQQKHLYVLLDDWERGYSIYRVGEDDFSTDSDDYLDRTPLARMEAQHPVSMSFATHGTKILAVRPSEGSPAISGFDTKTMGVTVCPLPQSHRSILRPFYASVGDMLFVMVYPLFEVLGSQPPPDSKQPWSWYTINTELPFEPDYVTGYALHPDGYTLFVSVKGWKPGNDSRFLDDLQQSTYSFDTESLKFRYHGEWMLPFKGQAHYDSELEAWIGLCKDGTGYVCSCDVPSRANCDTMPAWKVGKDKVFDHKSMRHRGATLLYMGCSTYCLVQCCAQKHDEWFAYPRHRVMKMCTFRLKYDKNGELRITGHRGRASMAYKVARDRVAPTLDPTAFCI
ncbi:hypothetical protein ACQ4PT_021124 [Festuca glaucescens]